MSKDNPTALIFDTDRSLASIGSEAGVERLFNVPPVKVSEGVDEMRTLFSTLFEIKQETITHPVFPEQSTVERKVVLNDTAKELGLDYIIIDTLSTLAEQTMEGVLKERNIDREHEGNPPLKQLDMQAWGLFKNKMMRFIRGLSQIELPIICNCHAKQDRDETNNHFIESSISGSSSGEMLRFFDIVAYTLVRSSGTGDSQHSTFEWILRPNPKYPEAKDRRSLLPRIMPQDLYYVINKYASDNSFAPKILVYGRSGQGKTTALATLNPSVANKMGISVSRYVPESNTTEPEPTLSTA